MHQTRYLRAPVAPLLTSTRKDDVAEELNQAVAEAHEVLVTATTVFPFTLFPDNITVDREKLTITRRAFFKVAEVTTVRIEDILNVTAHLGPFLGSIKVSTRFFDLHKPYVLNYLSRGDVLRIKRIMQGYITATQKKIDCSGLSTPELVKMLDELGEAVRTD